ncbi:ELO family [Pavlovales sp. CCMP2436]|nr:ELO family [Pavlovales sp. CCMP2436]
MARLGDLAVWLDVFDGRAAAAWFNARSHVPVIATLCYGAMLLLLPRLLVGRKPLKLHGATFYWNAMLTLFSVFGTAGCLPTLLRVLGTRGFQFSCCADVFEIVGNDGRGAPYFWAAAFVFSKQLEFGDTMLLLLKKKPVSFLHSFHHISVALLTWIGFGLHAPVAMWCGTMNYTVHSLMYAYYAAMASPTLRPIARPFAGAVTLLQLAQMVVASGIHLAIVGWHLAGAKCWWDPPMLLCTLLCYIVYLALFAEIFVSRYLLRRRDKAE